MKKLTLFWMLGLSALPAVAQHSLTFDRNALRGGDQLVKQQVEYKDPGSTGKDLIWDFTFLQPINEQYTLDYSLADDSDSTRVSGLEHRTHYYYRQTKDSLLATGFENATTLMRYITPEYRMHYPFAYGDTLYSPFEGRGEYCHYLQLHVKGYTRTSVDAVGELLLPNSETVKQAVRVHTLRYYTQTGKDSVQMTHDTYAWYAAGIRYPVFESIKTSIVKLPTGTPGESGTEAGAVDTTVFTTSFYYPPEEQVSTNDLPEQEANGSNVNPIYHVFTEATYMPNPVVDNLLVSYKLTRSANVWFSLHNANGILIRQTSPHITPEGFNSTEINMSQQIPGSYTLYVHVDDMMVKQVIIKK